MTQAPCTILVSIGRPQDIDLAKAVFEALGQGFEYCLLFASEGLRDRFGDTSSATTCDLQMSVLHAGSFGMYLSFAGPQATSNSSELLLCHLFNEIGIPTVEVQSTLLQSGCPPLVNALIGSGDRSGMANHDRSGSYAAKTVIYWGGSQGVGYVRSSLAIPPSGFVRSDLTSITSGLDWEGYSDKERYKFAIAVVKLALAHPRSAFVWLPRADELAHPRAVPVIRMVEDYKLANLVVEQKEPPLHAMARARAGIAMVSTSLLDLGALDKPVLLFSTPATDRLVRSASEARFKNYFELEGAWPRFREAPEQFRHEVDVPVLDGSRLRGQIEAATVARTVAVDWMPTALRYLAYLREGEASRPRLDRLDKDLLQLELRIATVEKSAATVERIVKHLPDRVSRVLERIGVLQRSTLAYKARRLLAGQVGGALRSKGPK